MADSVEKPLINIEKVGSPPLRFVERISSPKKLGNIVLQRPNALALIASGYFSGVFQQNRPH
jgi:hypothetical protein